MLNYRELNLIFRALADPTRRYIFEQLCDGEATVSQLAENLPLALSTILKHLQELEKNGVIHTDKSGRVRTCYIEPQAVRLLDQWIREYHAYWARSPARSR
ncbi:MAG TPA: metalloregulator ArsR/SmtB family transcription factor [Steroidobacteraceae bacterium]|jgi:DNA-binding transcriptional ArsR family regulator|nr:metalloregulator ArsR/SmtB family transcription factor [Steroidobacteraceae bacterium]